CRAISSRCLKPFVTISPSPGNEPSSDSSALVATVVPCETPEMSLGSQPACWTILWTPAMKPIDGSCGVVGVLVVCTTPVSSSKATTSVNVPPVSSASLKRAIVRQAYAIPFRQPDFATGRSTMMQQLEDLDVGGDAS